MLKILCLCLLDGDIELRFLPQGYLAAAPLSSKLNGTVSACKGSVLLDAVKPYQKTVTTVYGERTDYSSSRYTFTPSYAAIKEGRSNKISAKITCMVDTGNNITKFNSANVTGVIGGLHLVVNGQTCKNGINGVVGSFMKKVTRTLDSYDQ